MNIITATIFAIGLASITAFSATASEAGTAKIVADLTDRSVNSVMEESYKQHKSFAQIADEAGKLDDYKMHVMVDGKKTGQYSSNKKITELKID